MLAVILDDKYLSFILLLRSSGVNVGRTVFSQITDHIDEYIFKTTVNNHKGHARIRHFTC